jgi:hypothetical protein
MTNLEPWYVKLNPKAYVPTLLYGNLNTPICESAEIIKAIDEKWDGAVRLQQACIDNQDIMNRFEELFKLHEDWDVETYTMIAMRRDIWLFKWAGPSMMLRSIVRAKNTIKDKELLDDKIKALDKRYFDIMVDYARTKPIDDEKARVILKKVSEWMVNGNKNCFALGTDTYTLGDVLLTTMMARLVIDSKFF